MTNPRITRDVLLMNMALLMSKRSTCQRKAVGAIITRDGRIISTGYNGPRSHEPHCDSNHCDIARSCTRSVHAETNAIRFAQENSISLSGCRIYVTSEPCPGCSERIIESGICSVIYFDTYWNSGVPSLIAADIQVERFVDKNEIYVR